MIARSLTDKGRYWILILPALAIMLTFYIWPLVEIFGISFSEPRPGFDNYASMFDSRPIRTSFVITFRVAAITTIWCLVLGYIVSYAIYNTKPKYVGLMIALVLLPFWLSVLIRSFAWIVLLGRSGVVNDSLGAIGLIDKPLPLMHNEFGVILSMVHVMLPFAILPIMANMKGINPSYVDAARGLGASELRAFISVYFPQTLPGVLSAALLVFVLSLGFYITPALLGGGRVLMISEYITYQIQELLNWGVGTSLSVALLLATAAVILAAGRFVNLRRTFLERG